MRDGRTAGAVHLCRVGKKDAIIAERIGCDRTLIVRWKSGNRMPTDAQKALLQAAYGIEDWEWDQPAANAPDEPVVKAIARELAHIVTPVDEVVANARSLQQKAMDLCKEVEGGTPEERVAILQKAAQVVAIAGKILGEDSRASKAKILRSPEWAEIQTEVFKALQSYPEALEAVVEKIQGLNA